MNSLVKKNDKYDVAIIGAGPAGLTCAMYAARANLNVCFIEKSAPGGKMTKTFDIQNWSGDESIKGYELSLKMLNHAKNVGAKHIFGNIVKINPISEFKHQLVLEDGKIIESKAIVIASGMISKMPEISNIKNFLNKGVSYCVICDGPMYNNMPAAIIGGGDSAFEESIYLSSIASEVHIFVRKSKAKAEKGMISRASNISNIKIHYNAEIVNLVGKDKLEQIEYIEDNKKYDLNINHLYPYIGFLPSNEFAKHLPIFDDQGFILTDENMETIIPNVYAIGDIRKKTIRQIVTAASDGAIVGKILTNKINK